VGCVRAGRRHGEVDATELQLLDRLRVVGELSGGKDLQLVATLRVLLELLPEQLGGLVARAARLVGVTELERRLRLRADGEAGRKGDREHRLLYEPSAFHAFLRGVFRPCAGRLDDRKCRSGERR